MIYALIVRWVIIGSGNGMLLFSSMPSLESIMPNCQLYTQCYRKEKFVWKYKRILHKCSFAQCKARWYLQVVERFAIFQMSKLKFLKQNMFFLETQLIQSVLWLDDYIKRVRGLWITNRTTKLAQSIFNHYIRFYFITPAIAAITLPAKTFTIVLNLCKHIKKRIVGLTMCR